MNTLKLLNVLVVDDHPLFRNAVCTLLRNSNTIESTDQAPNGLEAIKLLKKKYYDIVLLDIEMPVLDGIETSKAIVKEYPNVKILILTSFDSVRFVIELMKIGVHGYILKSIDEDKIVLAMQTVMDNKKYMSPEIQKAWDEYLKQKPKNNAEQEELTVREIEIVEEICNQNTSSEIAKKLSISKSTVENHRRNIQKKLNTDNIVAVVIYAIQRGIYKIKKK